MNSKALYAVIDLKSFYASCECASRGLDIFTTPLVVADASRTKATIIMSTTPYLKTKYGVPNVCRWKDLPNIPGLILATPRMAYYIEMSSKIVSIFLDYVDEEDIHVYSIDESFLNIGPYLRAAGCDATTFVQRIQKRIKDETGLLATAGIGPNMFMAKACLDNEGKKKPPYVATWTMDDVKTKLWKIEKLTDIWGINVGISTRLNKIGIRTIQQLAEADSKLLEKEFGIMGDQLKDIANGIDESDIRVKHEPKEKSLSAGQTLIRDYNLKETRLVIRELNDDLCFRLRRSGRKTSLVSLAIVYSAIASERGFGKQVSLNIPTDDNDKIYKVLLDIFETCVKNKPIKQVYISFGKLSKYSFKQIDLADNEEAEIKKEKIHKALDEITIMYGKNAVLRASALKEESTAIVRHTQIGGHKA